MGWSLSVVFHLCLIAGGVAWLIHPAQFRVRSGRTSTEIQLVMELAPMMKPTPPKVSPLTLVSSPPLLKPPEPQPGAAVAPKATKTPPPSALPILKRQVATRHQAARREASPQVATQAAKGAVQAEPDELHNDPPEYPEISRAEHEQGIVILKVEVTASGAAADVAILKTSGYFRLDQAARKAVQRWKFNPARAGGTPISSEAEVPVRFKLQ